MERTCAHFIRDNKRSISFLQFNASSGIVFHYSGLMELLLQNTALKCRSALKNFEMRRKCCLSLKWALCFSIYKENSLLQILSLQEESAGRPIVTYLKVRRLKSFTRIIVISSKIYAGLKCRLGVVGSFSAHTREGWGDQITHKVLILQKWKV